MNPARPLMIRPKTKPELVQQVIAMGERGDPHKWITAETGLAMSTVSQILRRAGLGRYTSSLDRKPMLQLALDWAEAPYGTDLHRLITHRRFPYGKLPSSTDTNAFVLKTLSAEIARLTMLLAQP